MAASSNQHQYGGGYKITAADAYEMRSRIFVAGSFLKILHLSEKAVPFSSVYFDLSSYDHVGYLDFQDLLKEWVLDETAAGLTASAETGDAGPSDYDRADKISTSSKEFRNALELLNNCLKDENIEALKRIGENDIKDEDSIAVGVGLHLLQKLTGTCITNKKKSESACPCGCRDKVPFSDNMCIGSSDTLHGELDMIADRVAVNVAEKLPTDDDVDPLDGACGTDDDGFETDDEGTETVEEEREERKRKYDRQLYQFLSQTIVFGWTEFNRHRELGPYIPSVFMDDKQFGFAVYNPITDCLVLGKRFHTVPWT